MTDYDGIIHFEEIYYEGDYTNELQMAFEDIKQQKKLMQKLMKQP